MATDLCVADLRPNLPLRCEPSCYWCKVLLLVAGVEECLLVLVLRLLLACLQPLKGVPWVQHRLQIEVLARE
jgi:hypothetical protein